MKGVSTLITKEAKYKEAKGRCPAAESNTQANAFTEKN
jgi:hypothetical protein